MSSSRKLELKVLAFVLIPVLAVLLYSHWSACVGTVRCNMYERPLGTEILPEDPHLIVRARPHLG